MITGSRIQHFRSLWEAAILLLVLLSPVASFAQTKVRLCWTSFASNMSGSWVAYEEGFFKKNGLDVELIHIQSTSRAIQAEVADLHQFRYFLWQLLHIWPALVHSSSARSFPGG